MRWTRAPIQKGELEALAHGLDRFVGEIIITDADPWVEKVTVENLWSVLKVDLIPGESDDRKAGKASDTVIITSTIPGIVKKISSGVESAICWYRSRPLSGQDVMVTPTVVLIHLSEFIHDLITPPARPSFRYTSPISRCTCRSLQYS